VLLGRVIGVPAELLVAPVDHIVAHHRWLGLGLLGNALEFHGYRW
jgi:hypothetical protein